MKITNIETELDWLNRLIQLRSSTNLHQYERIEILEVLPAPDFPSSDFYSQFVAEKQLSAEERVTLILALSTIVQPWLLDVFKSDKIPTAFGGIIGKNRGFIPTAETVLFILAGSSVSERIRLMYLFHPDHFFYKENLLSLESTSPDGTELNGVLTASKDLVDLVLSGKIGKPDLQIDFPAKLLSTEMNWEDVVLSPSTFSQLNEIELWIEHNHQLSADAIIGKKLKPGFRALFYGPPGTGKTLSACLIGKKTERDVYRVDLSTVVSKYIGETEKNLAKLFDRASRKNWILFFDEADALFGKRTDVRDAHDKYANQEVSYLLQRIEYHEGLVILATNMKNNIDNAFLRRFQSIVYFPLPKTEERLLLWEKAFSETVPAGSDIVLNEIAKKHELSGSLILNIVSHATLRALNEKSNVITMRMLQDAIARELAKEGRTL